MVIENALCLHASQQVAGPAPPLSRTLRFSANCAVCCAKQLWPKPGRRLAAPGARHCRRIRARQENQLNAASALFVDEQNLGKHSCAQVGPVNAHKFDRWRQYSADPVTGQRVGRISVAPLNPSSTNCNSGGTGVPSLPARSLSTAI